MIGDFELSDRPYPTPGLVRLVCTPLLACQAVVEGRRAEVEGRWSDAADHFSDALGAAADGPSTSPLVDAVRAAARAGIARVAPDDEDDASRRSALAWFERQPSGRADANDIADRAALTAPGELRLELLEAAASIGQPPAWVARELLDREEDHDRTRLLWSLVRQAPLVPEYHAALGLKEASDEAACAALSFAAALLFEAGDVGAAVDWADLARRKDGHSTAAALVLADALRVAGEAQDAIAILDELEPSVDAGSPLGRTLSRARARALEAAGRRRDALQVIGPVTEAADALALDLVFAARLHTALGEREAARDDFDTALAIAPDDVPTVYASMVDRVRRQQLDAALADVEQALWRRPRELSLIVLRAHLRARTGVRGAPDDDIDHAVAMGANPVRMWSQLSSLCSEQGDVRGASSALARALEIGGDGDVGLLLRHGAMLLELREHRRALSALRRAARLEPSSIPVSERLADALMRAGRPADAVRELDRAMKRVGRDPMLLALRGRGLRRSNDLDGAERDLRDAAGDLDLDWPAAELFGVLAERDDVASAVAWALDELSPARVASLALSLWDAEDHEGALALAEAALDRSGGEDPNEALLLLVRGVGRWQLEADSEADPEAESSLRRAVELLPATAKAHVLLGVYLAGTGRLDDAQQALDEALTLDPGSEDIVTSAVSALRDAGANGPALEILDAAIFRIGEALELLVLRAQLMLDQDPRAAIEIARNARAMGAADLRLDRVEALALFDLAQYADAVEKLGPLLDRDPGDLEVRFSLASSLHAMGASGQARDLLSDIDDEQLHGPLLVLRAQIRSALGDAGGLDDFERALREAPSDLEARAGLIEAADELGRREVARARLRELLDDPELVDEPEVVRLAWVLDESELALERANDSLSREPLSARMLTLKAGILVEQERYTDAIDVARAALRVSPDSVSARYTLSLALQGNGSAAEALNALGDGDDDLLVRQRVAVLLDLGMADEATSLVEKTLAADGPPFDDDTWTTLCDELVDRGILQPIATLLERRLDASAPASVLRLAGSVLMSMGRFDLAVGALERARRRDRRLDVDADLAWAYSNLDPPRPKAVLAACQRALKRAPGDIDLIKSKADAQLQLGQTRSAQRLYRSVLDELSSSASARGLNWVAGWCNYRLGDYDRALDHLLRAISASTERDGADRFDLALVLLVSGHVARAKREYAQAVREAKGVTDPLRSLGVLSVALIDVREAMARGAGSLDMAVAHELANVLEQELKSAAKGSLRAVRPFLRLVEQLVATSA